MPKNEAERKRESWQLLQYVHFYASQINGKVADNTDKIVTIDKDVTVAKRLGWIALTVLGLVLGGGGLYAALF
jgi:hypothetical protein